MGSQGGPKTGGRKPGSKNKLTLAKLELRQQAVALLNAEAGPDAFKGDGVDFLQAVYRSPNFDFEVRMEAATRAAAFERAKKTESTIDDKRQYVVRMPNAPADLEAWKAQQDDTPQPDEKWTPERLEQIRLAAQAKVTN